jgi:2-polyprenyl-3-methyl-5-hydroxy-6-metoxy-1,4-benzoquinol methylase
MIRKFIAWNRRVSRWERSLLARVVPGCSADGPTSFRERVLPGLLRPGLRVLDVGGGKRPAISPERKHELGLYVVGLDVSDTELEQAPARAYDATIVGDIAAATIPGQYDLVFSRAVLEHVENPAAAIVNMARILAPGGLMAHVMPCRNAPFAVINRGLGNRAARRLLFTIFPEKQENSGFLAYYRHCTPSQLSRICRDAGLEVVNLTPYYNSGYTSFFAPLYTIEMLRQALMCSLQLHDFAEGFSIVARKPERGPAASAIPVFAPAVTQ